MARSKKRGAAEINSSSMADIAFLLLIFFLVTTTIANDKGLTLQLPPKPDDIEQVDIKIPERNIFKILINSSDKLLVENEPLTDMHELREMIKKHVLNNGRDPDLSDSPDKAVVSLKANRGTSYDMFIAVYNEAQGAYYDIYAERAGVTNKKWREISNDLSNPDNKVIYDKAREGIPMAISIAEPN
ncbi:MAG: biopolymer transporter ExbD [Cyclobacteriaceae bacterium]|nr:biopolymer transporter ExbD [Cyclobacteriaceae bacterium]